MGFEFRVSVWGVEGAEFKATAGALRYQKTARGEGRRVWRIARGRERSGEMALPRSCGGYSFQVETESASGRLVERVFAHLRS